MSGSEPGGGQVSPMCDGCVHVDRLAPEDIGALDEYLLASRVQRLVVVIRSHTGRTISHMGKGRDLRVLVGADGAEPIGEDWPVVGLAMDRADDLERAMAGTDRRRFRVVHLGPYALNEAVLGPVRETIGRHGDTTFVLASLGGAYWRFASLLAWELPNVFLDTSAVTARRLRSMFANRYQLAQLLDRLYTKVIFASGFPEAQGPKLLALVQPWLTTDNVRQAVLRDNAIRVYFDANHHR